MTSAERDEEEGGLFSGNRKLRWIGIAVSVVSVVSVILWARGQEAPTLPSQPDELAALALAILLYGLATIVRAERWTMLLHLSGGRPSRTDSWGITAVGYMGNNVLPARGGDVMRVYLMAPRAQIKIRTTIGTLLAERVLDVITLFLFFVVLAYGILREVDAPSGVWLALGTAAVLALLAGGFLVISVVRTRDLLGRFREIVRPLTRATRELWGRQGVGPVLLTLVVWVLEAGTYLAVSEAVGLGLGALEAIYLVAVTGLFVILPAGPSNAGTLDAGVLVGARALGASGTVALSYLVLLRFVLVVPVTVVGLAILVWRYGGWNRARAAPAEASGA